MPRPLILASTSRFRQSLLANAGIEFSSEAPGIDERQLEEQKGFHDLPPDIVATELAEAKARAVSQRHPHALVLGCDQTMALGEHQFHKPTDRLTAKEQLLSLRGRTHQLNSGMALVAGGRTLWRHVEVAELSMRAFSMEFLETYLDRVGERAFQSVGGYQLEAEGIQLFEKISGDYFTIIGLPLIPLLAKLRELGEIHG